MWIIRLFTAPRLSGEVEKRINAAKKELYEGDAKRAFEFFNRILEDNDSLVYDSLRRELFISSEPTTPRLG